MREEDSSIGFPEGRAGLTSRWGLRGVIAVLLVVAAGTIWFTNAWLTARFSETTRVRTELRSAL